MLHKLLMITWCAVGGNGQRNKWRVYRIFRASKWVLWWDWRKYNGTVIEIQYWSRIPILDKWVASGLWCESRVGNTTSSRRGIQPQQQLHWSITFAHWVCIQSNVIYAPCWCWSLPPTPQINNYIQEGSICVVERVFSLQWPLIRQELKRRERSFKDLYPLIDGDSFGWK